MSPLFRRKGATVETHEEVEAPEVDGSQAKSYTPAKGRPTPKRSEAGKRRAAQPAPKDNKEARTRMRQRMRTERAESYEGMRRGEDKYLTARDRGPVRRLVRDLVDSRRNVGTFFFGGALLVIIGSMQTWPAPIRLASNILWLVLIIVIVLDAFLISRMIRKNVRERFPDYKARLPSLYFYGFMRSVVFRRMRSPKPQVKVGDTV